jgi:hypothetical protein
MATPDAKSGPCFKGVVAVAEGVAVAVVDVVVEAAAVTTVVERALDSPKASPTPMKRRVSFA